MILKNIISMERFALLIFSFTMVFAFSGMFFFADGKTYLSNLLVGATLVGAVALYLNRYPVGFKNRDVLWVLFSYAIYLLVNRLIHGDQYGIMRAITYVLCFAFIMPKNITLLKAGCYGIILGGSGVGIISVWQYCHGAVRVDGFTNAIIFSQAALTLAILNSFIFLSFSSNKFEKVLSIIATLLSLIALYLSQSRGVWLALIVVVVCWLLFKIKEKPLKYISISLGALLVFSALFFNSSIVKGRIYAGISDVVNIENGNYNTSLGFRVVAWKSAWLGFLDSPLIGVGTDGFDKLKQEQVKKGIMPEILLSPVLAHAHNQYLQALVIRGSGGFILLLGILVLPAMFFAKEMGFISAGVFIPIAFAVSAISDVPFEHQSIMYLYSLSLIFILLCHELKQELS
ncbi:TPA: O-antigen ligase family protein [Aeromonas sobria]|nr:O-antigen ligase family protein [Aeromonas sobria]